MKSIAADIQLLEMRALLSAVLTDTTPTVTVKATEGTSTGNVVLATFTDSIPASGVMSDVSVPGTSATNVLAVSGNSALGYYTFGGVDYGFLYNISAGTFTGYAPPGASSTLANGISGNIVVGFYADGSNVNHGYLYNMSTATYTSFDPAGSVNTIVTRTTGNSVLGYYESGGQDFGFLYNISTGTFTTLAPPGTISTLANGISGNTVVGYYADTSGVPHGYLYNTSTATYSTFDPPGSAATFVTDTNGNNVLGFETIGGVDYGFLYNISTATFTTLSPPGASSTLANGISGNTVVGFYADGLNVNHGYRYNLSTGTYATFDPPGSTNTFVSDTSNGDVVGNYFDTFGVQHGFLYILPPSPSDFTVFVDWGGSITGTPTISVQLVSQTANSTTWEVVGNATYANTGIATTTVSVSDATGASVQTNDVSFDVFAPSQKILTDTTPVQTFNATEGNSTGNVVLATFTDAIPASGLMTDVSVPGTTATNVLSVSGNNALGFYTYGGVDYGFLYDISTGAFTGYAPPGASSTLANGISGNIVVGFYADGSNVNHGYLYNITTATYTTFDPAGSNNTIVTKTTGNDVLGYYESGGEDFGFLYDISTGTFTTLAPPGTSSTLANGISGSIVVGYYADGSNVNHGYLYNTATSTYTTFDPPGSSNTYVTDTTGNDVLGFYTVAGVDYGFLYSITTASFTTLSPPGASSALANGLSGNSVVGFYADGSNINHGYLYNLSTGTYSTFDPPGSINTFVSDTSGSNIVGNYFDANGVQHGFLYQTPPDVSDFTASVNWGGALTGTPTVTVQLVSQTGVNSTWEVLGNATYAEAGNYTVTVATSDSTGSSVTTDNTTISVADAALTNATPSQTFTVATGITTGDDVLATFSDANPLAPLSDYSASVNWGGSITGSPSVSIQLVSRTASASVWEVVGNAIYANSGVFTPTVTVTDDDGAHVTSTNTTFNVMNEGILVLDATGSGALTDSANGTITVDPSAVIVVASTSSTAVIVGNNGQVSASVFDLHSATGTQVTGNGKLIGTVVHNVSSTIVADPLANVSAPALPTNTFSAVNVSGNSVVTLQPGIYVGGIHVSGSAKVTLAPGTYYLQGGGFSAANNAIVTGNGVLIDNAPQTSNDVISISNQAKVTLTAPTTGNDQGIVVFQSRTSTAGVTISGNGVLTLTGTFYATSAKVTLTQNASLSINGPSGHLIADDLSVSGNASLTTKSQQSQAASTQTVSAPAQQVRKRNTDESEFDQASDLFET